MFKALEFQYNGKSSNDFSLKLINFSNSGVVTNNIGIPLEIEDVKIKRNPKPFFFGVETVPNLKFKLQIAYMPEKIENKIITRPTMGAIIKWLCQREYKEFKIIDSDYSNIVYNCMFQNPQQIEVGNIPYALEVDVVCDRPYGYRKQTIEKTVNGSVTFNLQNIGFDNDYIYPEIEFTLSSTGTSMSITNNTDANNNFSFNGLNVNETVYVNNTRQEIISSTGLNRNSKFNFKWFRITPDFYNNITITGSGTVKFRIEFPMPF